MKQHFLQVLFSCTLALFVFLVFALVLKLNGLTQYVVNMPTQTVIQHVVVNQTVTFDLNSSLKGSCYTVGGDNGTVWCNDRKYDLNRSVKR